LDVFEGFFRHLRLLIRAGLGGLAACTSGPQEHKIMVPMAQWIARLDWNFILPPSLAVREEREPSGDRSRSEFARSRPAFHSAAHIDLKDHSVWFGPPTLYACPLPHAMEGWLRFTVEVSAPYTCGQ